MGHSYLFFQPEQLVCVALHSVVQIFREKELGSDFQKPVNQRIRESLVLEGTSGDRLIQLPWQGKVIVDYTGK